MATPDTLIEKPTLASEEYIIQAMPRFLGTFDMTTTFLMIIFYITLTTNIVSQGAVGITYLLIGAFTFFIPCAIASAQLGKLFPHEGSLYNWSYQVLGRYWSFFSGFCAWLSGILVMVSGGNIIVTYLQGLNHNWLTAPWQEGLVIIGLILFSAILAVQRYRTVQNIVNVAVGFEILAVILVGLAGVIWLVTGHHAVGSFNHVSDWSITPGNFLLFGTVAFSYIGAEVPLTMAGEIQKRKAITRHLLWGVIIIVVGYLICSFSLLVVEGPVAGSATPFALVSEVDLVLGKFFGDITALCVILFFTISPVVYTYTFGRILLVGSIDRQLPRSMGKLNKHRVPASAIIFQTIIAVTFVAIAFIIAPALVSFINPADFALEVYNVSQAAATLVWAISTVFLFINLALCYFQHRQRFHEQRIFPMPVLWGSIVIGSLACLVAIVDTLLYAWIPQISNGQWWYLVGGLTIVCLVIAAIGSLIANGEATWEEAQSTFEQVAVEK